MNTWIQGLVLMNSVALASTAENTRAIDEAAISTIIESVAILADRGHFEALERLYAEEIRVDYTSLASGEIELKSPQVLMNQWAATLPGFDRTRHQLSNISVVVDCDSAVATADVIADHYVDNLFWQVVGSYRYELVKQGQWRITAMTFTLEEESGTRDVFGPATRNAAENPPAYVTRQQTQQAVQSFLESLESKDMETLASLWAEEAVQDMPYSPPGHPKRVVGKAALVELYSSWPEVSGRADFTSELVFYPMQDSETVFVEFSGDVDIIPTGRTYQQIYGGLFHVVDGQIQLFREYYDPAPFARAFGLDGSVSQG